LRRDCEGNRILHLGKKAPNAKKLLDYLFVQPVVTAQQITDLLSISLVSAYKLMADFERIGILKETTGFKRNRFFLFKEYLDIFHQ